MHLPDIEYDEYWQSFHRVDGWWSGSLDLISAWEGLDLLPAERSPVGRNVVLLAGEWVVKLVPPFWHHMWERERIALDYVGGRLSVRTPELRAAGRIGAWGYLVMERLEGASLGWRAELGSPEAQTGLAALQGRLTREISLLPPVEALKWDWNELYDEDRRELAGRLDNVPPRLAATAADYVAGVGDLSSGDTVLHGDLASINLLRTEDRNWVLIDWSDAAVGPADHEFISPFMHQFRGDPHGLAAFWSGYGAVPDPVSTRDRIMARSILKYADLLSGFLGDLPGPLPASWPEAAERFTLIS